MKKTVVFLSRAVIMLSLMFVVSACASSGMYMGIIGFSDNINPKKISLLDNRTAGQNQRFISTFRMEPNTGLYYAVDSAINMLRRAKLPKDLGNVYIVTFTDGLDNQSIRLKKGFNSRDAYRDYLQNRIRDVKIKRKTIEAFSIGLPGDDVRDHIAFEEGVRALASSPNNFFVVDDMAQVNEQFAKIAGDLLNVNSSQSIELKIPAGYDDGLTIRFTFDRVLDASRSTQYIQGTIRRYGSNQRLENVSYHGLTSDSGATVKGKFIRPSMAFNFEDIVFTSGGSIAPANIQQWERLRDGSWQPNSEFKPEEGSEITIIKKSAVVVFVLDCTTSLGRVRFEQMQAAADRFIRILNGDDLTGNINNAARGSTPPAPVQQNTSSNITPPATVQQSTPSASIPPATVQQNTPSGRTYNIGDTGPAGGLVFYDKGVFSEGWRYLEAAPVGNEMTRVEWGRRVDVPGTNTGIGSGRQNTRLIVDQLNRAGETGRAAQLCAALNSNGFADWFLPSREELNLMFKNLSEKGLGGFNRTSYWSSSQHNRNEAHVQDFNPSSGRQHTNNKFDARSVRAIRQF